RVYKRLGHRKWAGYKKYGMRWVGTEGIFSAVKRKYGENTVSRSKKGLIAEGYQRFWAYDTIKCYAESKGSII
ncbi:MAG: IS5/IS1182 family transposase, partial [Nitrososphaeria archaeon]